MREILLFIHIIAVGAWVGANVTQLIVNPAMQKVGGGSAAAWMRQTARMGRVLYSPAAIVALVTGFWLVIDSKLYEFEHVFVAVGILMVIVGAVLGMKVFGPGGREAADHHDAGDESAAAAVNGRLRNWVLVDSALLAVTIYVMVAKIGA